MTKRLSMGRWTVWSLGGAAIVGLVVTGGWWLESGTGSTPPPARPDTNPQQTARAAGVSSGRVAVSRRPPWVEGAVWEYSGDFGTRMANASGDPDAGAGIDGALTLTLTVESVDEAAVRIQGRISGLSLAFERERTVDDGGEAKAQAALRPPFLLTLSPQGRIESLALDPGLAGLGHIVVRNVVAALQFVWPEDEQLEQWTTKETDHNGEYRALYRRRSAHEVEKTKLEYTHLAVAEGLAGVGAPGQVRVDSRTLATLGQSALPREIRSDELLSVPLGEAPFASSSSEPLSGCAPRVESRCSPPCSSWRAARGGPDSMGSWDPSAGTEEGQVQRRGVRMTWLLFLRGRSSGGRRRSRWCPKRGNARLWTRPEAG